LLGTGISFALWTHSLYFQWHLICKNIGKSTSIETSSMFEIYRPSGRFGVLTIPMVIIGLVAAIALAFVYQLLLDLIPLIYISFLVTLGLGFAAGIGGSMIVSAGKVRNVMLAGLIGILLTVSALGAKYYFQYRSMLAEVVDAEMQELEIPAEQQPEFEKAVAQEFTFMRHLELRAAIGWQIGRRGGMPIQGVFVYLIWLVEAGIVGYLAVKVATGRAREPYSEKLDAWASEAEVVMTLPISSPEMVSKIRAATSVEDLLTIPIPETDESHQFAVYTVKSIEGEELEDAYLSVELITLSINNKGEQEKKEEPLVKYAILSSEQRHQLVENASLLQEALADFREAKISEMLGLEEDAEQSESAVTDETGMSDQDKREG
jgi:hypothetical protein